MQCNASTIPLDGMELIREIIIEINEESLFLSLFHIFFINLYLSVEFAFLSLAKSVPWMIIQVKLLWSFITKKNRTELLVHKMILHYYSRTALLLSRYLWRDPSIAIIEVSVFPATICRRYNLHQGIYTKINNMIRFNNQHSEPFSQENRRVKRDWREFILQNRMSSCREIRIELE